MESMNNRYFLRLSYDGTNYNGWQFQPNGHSVQAEIERALRICFGYDISVTGAGRTDTGVHAGEMFAHFDLDTAIDAEEREQYRWKMNNLLPFDIAIKVIHPVAAGAHARFDAVSRTYEYHILTEKNPFRERYCWYWQGKLDVETMNKAAGQLIGRHDFQCFSKVNTDVNNFICEVQEAYWIDSGDELTFVITANRFLRNMVRAIVGTLFDIGRGKLQPSDLKAIIDSRDRCMAGASVPAKGLVLTSVEYPYEVRVESRE